jgi:hypothetical protein
LSVFTLVTFAWIFFRAGSLTAALFFIQHLSQGWDFTQASLWMEQIRVTLGQNYPLAILIPSLSGWQVLGLTALQVLFLEIVQALQKDTPLERILAGQYVIIRWGAYYALAFNIILFGSFIPSTFIYFQF